MPEPNPCDCPGPGWCERYQKTQHDRAHAICRGEVLTPEKCAVYRANWARLRAGIDCLSCPHLGDPGEPRRLELTRGPLMQTWECLHPARPEIVTIADCLQCPYRPGANQQARPAAGR